MKIISKSLKKNSFYPIHDNCVLLNGPVRNGVFSDKSKGILGESHPSNVPCERQIILATRGKMFAFQLK